MRLEEEEKKNNIKCKDWCTVPGSEAHTTHTNVAINFLKRVIMMKIPWVHLWSSARAIIFKIAHTNASKFILNVCRRGASNLLLQRANYSQIDSHCTVRCAWRRIGYVFLLRTIHIVCVSYAACIRIFFLCFVCVFVWKHAVAPQCVICGNVYEMKGERTNTRTMCKYA